MGGIPYQSQKQKAVCAVYDEISAVSCYETIKQGYDTRITICYRQESELMNLVKMINRIIPRMVQDEVELEFFQIKIRPEGGKNYLVFVNSILEILLRYQDRYVSVALSPLVFSTNFIEDSQRRVFKTGKIPIIPLAGAENNLFDEVMEIGSERSLKRLEKVTSVRTGEIPDFSKNTVNDALKTLKKIVVKVGPNNVHDILDSLENH